MLALAKKLQVEVCEWINPVQLADFVGEGRPVHGDSMLQQFQVELVHYCLRERNSLPTHGPMQLFLQRARRYQSLSFAGANTASARRIILLEVTHAPVPTHRWNQQLPFSYQDLPSCMMGDAAAVSAILR